MRRLTLLCVGPGLILAAVLAFAAYLCLGPTTLRIAVVRDSDDHAILTAAAQEAARGLLPIRLKLVTVETLAETAHAVETDRADLAVVRSDVAMPVTGQTVLIMRKSVAVLMAPPQAGLHTVDDIRGHRIGLLVGPHSGGGRQALLDSMLAQYEVPPSDVRKVALTLGELESAMERKDIDVVLALGAQGSATLAEAVNVLTRASHAPPVFIPVTEAKAIAQRSPEFEAAEVVRGAFGGAQPKPAADIETLGVTTRLVARHDLSADLVGEIMQLLLDARPVIGTRLPVVNSIEAPPSDKGAALPVHPGAIAYLDGDTETFFDKYGDFIYIGAMVLSLIGTVFMAVSSKLSRAQSTAGDRVLERLVAIMKTVQSCGDVEALDPLQREADALLFHALEPGSLRESNPNHFAALNLAMTQVRHAIAERRQILLPLARAAFAPRIVRD